MQPYTREYYAELRDGSRRSANAIVPLVLKLIQPQSVVDVGCGNGSWLAVFQQHGIDDLLGVDGGHVEREDLEISDRQFVTWDLTEPLRLKRSFDLALSLEVAEHLPAECSKLFVEMLVNLAPAVLFSAAVPHQEGEHHINEQWPDYWAERFLSKGYVPIDCLRKQLWDNDEIDWWYVQNLIMFVKQSDLGSYDRLSAYTGQATLNQLALVHPRNYLRVVWKTRVLRAEVDLADIIPAGNCFILVDQDQFGDLHLAEGRRVLPFLERGGKYWGPPADDETAVSELERLRRCGASFFVFGWPAFWWLRHYAGLQEHLRSRYHCILENERLIAYDLRRSSEVQRRQNEIDGKGP